MTARPGPKKKLSIRPYRDGDRDALVGLWDLCGLTTAWNDPDRDIARFRESANSEILVASLGGQLIGGVCVGHDGHRGWIYYLAVAPDQRGQGYGTAILRHGETWLASRKVAKAQLLVRPANLATRVFYARAGYEPNPCAIMQRWLADHGAPSLERGRGDGQIPITITFLEMTQRPTHPHLSPQASLNYVLLRLQKPSVAFYRYLYNRVGEPWLWFERRAMSDAELAGIIHDERVEIHVLHVDGEPAGFAELDRRRPPDIELAYFGLMPGYIGKGLGRYLLTWIIDAAWNHDPKRLWVNTNTLDHPKALPLYQRCGFWPYEQKEKLFDDPRLNGLIPGYTNRH